MLKLGWTNLDLFHFLIDNLHVNDYIGGPKEDKDAKYSVGIIYKFKKVIKNEETVVSVYIKIKKCQNFDKVIIISFHEEEV
ncbi:MAG: hypothetical protein FXF54_03175 [Kosmotoga sp.]|nr:MAG: hypothetical protein FXF54_03175 [Kosmotoga sp.]